MKPGRRLRGLLRRLAVLLVVLVVAGVIAWSQRYAIYRRIGDVPPYTHDGGAITTMMVPMRDGARLSTRVELPGDVEVAPTVLIRNPYSMLQPFLRLMSGVLARSGYACVLQDVRGQGASEGTWEPLVNERNDGVDTLAWLRVQPFVDGNMALLGPSYLGATQWAVADVVPPEVKTMVPIVFGPDLHPVLFERGLFHHEVMTAWAALMPTPGMRVFSGSGAYAKMMAHQPADTADEAGLGLMLPWYREWLASPAASDPLWQRDDAVTLRTSPGRVTIPMLFVGSLFDPFFESQQRAWQQLATKDQSVFILGPWNHLGKVTGDVDMGPAADSSQMQWPLLLDWLDHHLKGAPLKHLEPGTVRILAPGTKDWQTLPAWPASTQTETWTLNPPATTTDPGMLSSSSAPPSTATTTLSWRSDPAAPVRGRGGASLLAFAFFPLNSVTPGPVEQGPATVRADGLSFVSAPVDHDVIISGAATLTLPVSATTPDAAVVARLIIEGQDRPGDHVLVREAAATLLFPTSDERADLPTPGDLVMVRVDFWPIEWRVKAGARLRLDLSSSSFPVLSNPMNRVGPWQSQTGGDVADVSVVVGDGRAQLLLPVRTP